ncbi:hypothetical protein QBC47DRAFT_463961 [Echria macrotheca]|uniref:Uncharacterized protein n=1 Tax=Echria macrotheca TaxID=438768 RepID=A0AAJ0B7M5_9PEZI|nr:hypothetical protein QBC47DRAFT_463961 [Echria macrotheca]
MDHGQEATGPGPEPVRIPVPQVDDRAPFSGDEFPQLRFPSEKAVLLVFLRQCGDAYTEKLFRTLTSLSTKYPSVAIHSVIPLPPAETDAWVISQGGEWDVDVIPDPDGLLYRRWGLESAGREEEKGLGGWWYNSAGSPWVVWKRVRLGVDEGIWGDFGAGVEGGLKKITGEGAVGWDTYGWGDDGDARMFEGALDDLPDLDQAVKALAEAKKRTGVA